MTRGAPGPGARAGASVGPVDDPGGTVGMYAGSSTDGRASFGAERIVTLAWPRWFAVVLLIAVAPLFVAASVQTHSGWRPIGDEAAVAVLAGDVLSARTPLIGMPSTLHTTASVDDRPAHPGPMLFWALAIPDRLSGSSPAGILFGTALVNAASILVVGLVVARLTGPRVASGVLALVIAMTCSLGYRLVVDPLNLTAALFPLLAACVLAWAAGAGAPRSLLGVAGFASFVSQAHLIFAPVAVAMVVAGAAGAAVGFVASARRGEPWRREAKITGVGTGAVLLACWSFPLWQQLTNRPGNLWNVATGLAGNPGERPLGLGWSLRFNLQSIGVPPVFASRFGDLATSWSALDLVRMQSGTLVVVALVSVLVLGIRRRDRVVAAGAAVATVALVVNTAVFARMPDFGPISPGAPPIIRTVQMWPVGCLVWCALAVSAARLVRLPDPVRLGAFVVAVAGLAAAPVIMMLTASHTAADADYSDTQDVVGRLAAQMEPMLRRDQPYYITLAGDILGGGDAEFGLIRELTHLGFDPRVASDNVYLGRAHAAPPGAARLALQAGGASPPILEPEAVLVAVADAASASERDEARRLSVETRGFVADPKHLTERGRAAIAAGAFGPDADVMRRLLDGRGDPVAGDDLRLALAQGLVRPDPTATDLADRAAAAQAKLAESQYSVYLVPAKR